ncbi:MAG: efflux RND transporter permease subunit [Nitrospiraceae bacterium]
MLGAGLAGIMIFLFLQSVKAALVVGLGHSPLADRGACMLMYLTGQSVNIMTPRGLALVIGTVLENKYRGAGKPPSPLLEMARDGRSAAEDSATELTLPIFVATVCILIVYLPIMFFTGIKYLFVPMAMTVAFAMLADYVVSMSVTLVILARLYQTETESLPRRPGRRRLVQICAGDL